MAKTSKKWVVLCTAAIGAVYAAGYYTTESQAAAVTASSHVSQAVSPNAPSVKASVYKDGTYVGSGSNRRGSIQVTVTIKSDKITDVEISDFAMHYSESDVANMPQEVIGIQSAQVQNVSGATYSTEAFSDAVQDALNQARAV